jgi:hypothetical protein
LGVAPNALLNQQTNIKQTITKQYVALPPPWAYNCLVPGLFVWRTTMLAEVVSPVTRKGSKVSGNIPGFSPGAFSNSSRGGGDSVLPQPSRGAASRHSAAPEPAEVQIIGPED